MRYEEECYPCSVPCSVYDTLICAGRIPDPYEGENDKAAEALSDTDVCFEKTFSISEEVLACDRISLTFDGIDTVADVILDGKVIGCTDNMHRSWTFDVTNLLHRGQHTLKVHIESPSQYIAQKQQQRPVWGAESTTPGFPHLRKAHCMFGWDWGPKLPDMGIWRDVTLQGWQAGRIQDVYYAQRHEDGRVVLQCTAAIEAWRDNLQGVFFVTTPVGERFSAPLKDGKAEIIIDHPQLWWVRGLGEQPLYTCGVDLYHHEEQVDSHVRRMGLRTLSVSQEKDEWGSEFCIINNGIKVFAMGANYIPEDQIIPRCTKERTLRLLQHCLDANYNMIRVWGGGWYPDECFYDFCDEHGLLVWQDFMFACAAYILTPALEDTIRCEIADNVIRLRNHASLALWCGNNEVESAWVNWGIPDDPEAKADYLRLFESIIPEMVARLDPETFYWPSSPSSYGSFRNPSSESVGDRHYWDVWHNMKPIEDFRQYHYRFCSEFGFESLPDIKTIRSFAGEQDLELCSHVMEAHQKCPLGHEKIMFYLAHMVNYPKDFERLLYCSQLIQAEYIRFCVEHMRRSRGRCMGALYWQVNDSNPVISWSGIDYFGRWKALHYAARRFYAPILLSCDDADPARPSLWVTNDTREDQTLTVVCRLRNNRAEVL